MPSGRRRAEAPASPAYPPAAHAVAGAIGGALATWACYPLELVRVEMQRSGKRADEERPRTGLGCLVRLYEQGGLYRGASAMVQTMLISSFITFYALEAARGGMRNAKSALGQDGRGRLRGHVQFLAWLLPGSEAGASLLASTLAGVLNVFLTTPLWNGTRRIMEAEEEGEKEEEGTPAVAPGLWSTMGAMAGDEGVLRLWHGTWSSLLLVSNPALQYFLYERLRTQILGVRQRRRRGGRSGRPGPASSAALAPLEAFVLGALAKTLATVVTYPVQLAQVLIRLRDDQLGSGEGAAADARRGEGRAYGGVADCLRRQVARGGLAALFRGMNSKLLQTVLQAAFTFVTYEQILAASGRAFA